MKKIVDTEYIIASLIGNENNNINNETFIGPTPNKLAKKSSKRPQEKHQIILVNRKF